MNRLTSVQNKGSTRNVTLTIGSNAPSTYRKAKQSKLEQAVLRCLFQLKSDIVVGSLPQLVFHLDPGVALERKGKIVTEWRI